MGTTLTQKTNILSVYQDINTYNSWYTIAEQLSRSALVPQYYKNNPESCLLAIDIANRNSENPLFVMQNLYVIQGKPSWSGKYCTALIKKHYPDKEVIWIGNEGTDSYGCYVEAAGKKGQEVTIAIAKAEGWYSKNPKWKNIPKLMLEYRAHSFWASVNIPDMLLGMNCVHEIIDISDINTINAEEETFIDADFEIVNLENCIAECKTIDELLELYKKNINFMTEKQKKMFSERKRNIESKDTSSPSMENPAKDKETVPSSTKNAKNKLLPLANQSVSQPISDDGL